MTISGPVDEHADSHYINYMKRVRCYVSLFVQSASRACLVFANCPDIRLPVRPTPFLASLVDLVNDLYTTRLAVAL
jgi:hypothetical protein